MLPWYVNIRPKFGSDGLRFYCVCGQTAYVCWFMLLLIIVDDMIGGIQDTVVILYNKHGTV